MELVCIDYLTLEPSKGGQHNILVITDHFTRYAQAIVTKNQTARTTADALFHNFIVHYGIPQKIHSDQGANFMSHLIKELCTLTGTKKSRTTPYHSMGNGMTERFNRALLEMLGTLEPEKKKNWKARVGPLVHAYNCTRHNSTNQSPYFLMFGRQPKLPIDLAFGLITEKERKPHTKYIQEIRERLVQAYKLASEASIKAQTKQKEGYDLRTRGAIIEPGDSVLVRIVAFDNKHKISDRWENDTYIVLKKPNLDIPVYTVQKENGQGRIRTLHRNLLLPVGYISQTPEEEKLKPIPKPRTRFQKKQRKHTPRSSDESSSSSSSEDDYTLVRQESTLPYNVVDVNNVQGQEELNIPESDGDALSVSDNRSDSESNRSASDEMERNLETISLFEEEEEQVEVLPQPRPVMIPAETVPTLRQRSTRTKQQPKWMTSGDYVTKSAVTTIENSWKQRADYLMKLLRTGILKGMEQEIGHVLISIVKGTVQAENVT
jgi:hypothetical protein